MSSCVYLHFPRTTRRAPPRAVPRATPRTTWPGATGHEDPLCHLEEVQRATLNRRRDVTATPQLDLGAIRRRGVARGEQ
jgi:hypothetical protein